MMVSRSVASAPPTPPTPPWFLWLDDTPRPGYLNMAIDSALLALAESDGVGFLRLYLWAPVCISFGRHEPATRRYDRAKIDALGVDVVRRPTGGRAVWHDADLTYAVAAPLGTLGTLAESCRRIHATLRDTLALLGVTATLAPPPAQAVGPGGGNCFAVATGSELLVGDRKVAGSAQLRTDRALLQHGSLLLAGDQSPLARLGPAAPPSSPRSSHPHSSHPHSSHPLGRPVSFGEAAEAVAEAARRWPGEWSHIARGWPIVERAAAYADGFRSQAWTWCR